MRKMKSLRTCDICGITNKKRDVYWNNKYQMFLCGKHYRQLHNYGKIHDASAISKFDPNEIKIYDEYAEITLRNQKHEITGYAKIDIDDVELCKQYKWCLGNMGYATARKNGRMITLHRYLLNYNEDKDLVIDHINRDRLDNRRNNLRITSKCINSANNSCYGIMKPNKNWNKWVVRIIRYKKTYRCGGFETEEEALAAKQRLLDWLDEHDEELKQDYEQNKELLPTGIRTTENGKFRAYFYYKGKNISVGTFNTKEEAIKAREDTMQEYIKQYKSA